MANRTHSNGNGDLNPSQVTTPLSAIFSDDSASQANQADQIDPLGAIAPTDDPTHLFADFPEPSLVEDEAVGSGLPEASLAQYVPEKPRGASLNQQLLTTVLPSMLVPLGVVGLMGYSIANQRAAKVVERDLQDRVLAAGESANDLLQEALKIPTIVASDPPVIDFANTAAQEAELD
jgi:hypothetical protein